ncbi:hypothetical protein THIOSC15_1290089 [uncultured Thiomicrorhabdus sp.]
MEVDDALKMVISGGVVAPEEKQIALPLESESDSGASPRATDK